jgi:hypothetical protein
MGVPSWRMKPMPVSEWAHFQQLFAEYQLLYAREDPDLALFMKPVRGSAKDEIYITGPGLEVVERFSPGGWQDSGAPSGEGLVLLVGTGDSWRHLGVSRHAP